jgi:N-acyl-D-aspartate/D-glutamate deacylase
LDPAARQSLQAEIEANRVRPKHGFREEALIFSDWRNIHIEELSADSPYGHLVGADMAAAAETVGKEPVKLFLDLLCDEGEHFSAIRVPKSSQDFRDFLTDDWTMFSTDTIGTSISRADEPWNTIQPHRRHYGTYPRILSKFVRDEGILSLGQAVRRMSGLPADFFGLNDRGYIREGYWADLVVVDLEEIDERGTWRVPAAYPSGIDHVLVNGIQAIAEGEFTGQLGGSMLRSLA